jgi:formiminotetrahydrofolate cyclodeaminase
LGASFRSAKLNVEVNLKYIKDDKFLLKIRELLEPLETETLAVEEKVSARVKEIMTE